MRWLVADHSLSYWVTITKITTLLCYTYRMVGTCNEHTLRHSVRRLLVLEHPHFHSLFTIFHERKDASLAGKIHFLLHNNSDDISQQRKDKGSIYRPVLEK